MRDDTSVIADKLRELRRNLNLTQEDLAHQIGVRVSTANRWEHGVTPSRLARRALAEFARANKQPW